MGISDLRNPADSIKIKAKPRNPKPTRMSWVLSVHSIQSEIRNPKSQIERIPNPKSKGPQHLALHPLKTETDPIEFNPLNSIQIILAVRKFLTTKSEITPLTSPRVQNKLSSYKNPGRPFFAVEIEVKSG